MTSGGGEQMACDNVAKGVFQEEIAYPVLQQGQRPDRHGLHGAANPGSRPASRRSSSTRPQLIITKETLHPGLCWSAKSLKN